jgi:hypothetical protein
LSSLKDSEIKNKIWFAESAAERLIKVKIAWF